MITSDNLLLKKSPTASQLAIICLIALPLWAQAQTVISPPKPTVRPQVQVESVAPTIAPVAQPESQGSDAIRVISEIEGLREELAALRNEIEVQQHELEKLGRRQRELFEDLDKRLSQQGVDEKLDEFVQFNKRLQESFENLEKRFSQQGSQLSQQAQRINEQEELASATQEQLSELKTETAENIASTADKIASIGERKTTVDQVTLAQTEKSNMVDASVGIGQPPIAETTPDPTPPVPIASQPPTDASAGSDVKVSEDTTSATVAVVPTTHPPGGISVTNSSTVSPILSPNNTELSKPAAPPVAVVGGGLGSASTGRPGSAGGPSIGQVATAGTQVGSPPLVGSPASTETRLPTNVAISPRRPVIGSINTPINDPAAEQAAYENAFELLKQSRYNEAIRAFNNLLLMYPGSTLADDAQYWISEAHYVTRGFESALLGFRTVVARYPSSPRVPDAMLRIGYIQYEVGAYNQARQTLTELVTRYPSSRVAVSAESRLKKMIQEGR